MMTLDNLPLAPELETTQWFNAPAPVTVAGLRGKVVVLGAFQMLCPGCVERALPQLQRVHESFDAEQVAVLGLHTVFEHHAAMTPVALEAFLHEYRLTFPVGVDKPNEATGMPTTMARYAMRGTPTLILVDAQGRLRQQKFGHEPDLRLGASIMRLVDEAEKTGTVAPSDESTGVCAVGGACT